MTDNRFPRPTRGYLSSADFQLSEFLVPRHRSGFGPLPGSFSCRLTSTHENGGGQQRIRTHRSPHPATGAQELTARHPANGSLPPNLGHQNQPTHSPGSSLPREGILVDYA